MIVEFFRGWRSKEITGADPYYWAIIDEKARIIIDRSIEDADMGILRQFPDVQKLAEIDFLDTDLDAVEILVDALLLSDILKRNVGLTRDSALYCLVNESLSCLADPVSEID